MAASSSSSSNNNKRGHMQGKDKAVLLPPLPPPVYGIHALIRGTIEYAAYVPSVAGCIVENAILYRCSKCEYLCKSWEKARLHFRNIHILNGRPAQKHWKLVPPMSRSSAPPPIVVAHKQDDATGKFDRLAALRMKHDDSDCVETFVRGTPECDEAVPKEVLQSLKPGVRNVYKCRQCEFFKERKSHVVNHYLRIHVLHGTPMPSHRKFPIAKTEETGGSRWMQTALAEPCRKRRRIEDAGGGGKGGHGDPCKAHGKRHNKTAGEDDGAAFFPQGMGMAKEVLPLPLLRACDNDKDDHCVKKDDGQSPRRNEHDKPSKVARVLEFPVSVQVQKKKLEKNEEEEEAERPRNTWFLRIRPRSQDSKKRVEKGQGQCKPWTFPCKQGSGACPPHRFIYHGEWNEGGKAVKDYFASEAPTPPASPRYSPAMLDSSGASGVRLVDHQESLCVTSSIPETVGSIAHVHEPMEDLVEEERMCDGWGDQAFAFQQEDDTLFSSIGLSVDDNVGEDLFLDFLC